MPCNFEARAYRHASPNQFKNKDQADMTFISYARNFEDVLLWRALKQVGNGFYVDIGPNDQTVFSLTRGFYEHGWHGLNVEPDEALHARLVLARPLDTNLNLAATGEPVGVSAAKSDEAMLAEARPLVWILDQHAPPTVHFLRFNVEEFERQHVQASDLGRWRPWVLVIHAKDPSSSGTVNEASQKWLADNRYTLAYFDGFNRFFVADEHAQLRKAFEAPVSILDDFSVGNDVIVTLHPERAEKRKETASGASANRDADLKKAAKPKRDTLPVGGNAGNAAGGAQPEVVQARAEALDAQMKMRTAEAQVKSALERAEAAESMVHALRASTSWRITAPVRALILAPRKFIAKYRRVRATPSPVLASVIKRRVLLAATRVPGARPLARQLHTRYPALWLRLRGALLSGAAGAGASMAVDRWKAGAAFDTVTRPVDDQWECLEIPGTFLATGTAGLDTDRLLRRVREVSVSTAQSERDVSPL